ncbi:MAG: MFS transporter [Syntrophomonadaceae bacterium]|nr:MFS transporter [Syntrophomonadaceae bacterium]
MGQNNTGTLLNQPKTNYRWTILIVLWLLYLINYFDRTAVLTLLPLISAEINLTHAQTGVAASIFFFAYAIAQVIAGWLADKIGPKKVMNIAICTFTFVTFLTGLTHNFTQFVLIRFGLGIGEGHHFSPANRAIADWFPTKEKGRATSFFSTTWAVGPAIIPIVVTFLAAAFGSWRPVFYVLAVPGVIGIFILQRWMIDTPRKAVSEGKVDQSEADYINDGKRAAQGDEAVVKYETKKALAFLFKDGSFIGYCIMLFCALGIYWGSTTWISSFLYEQHGFSLKSMGALVSLPYAIAFISMMLGGTAMDKWFKSKAKPILMASFLPAIPILFYIGAVPKGHIATLVVMLMLNGFFVNLFWGVIYAYPQVRYPKEIVGTAIGVSNGFGQLGSFVAPLVAGFLVVVNASGTFYTKAFIFFAALALVAAVFAFFLDEKPIDPVRFAEFTNANANE